MIRAATAPSAARSHALGCETAPGDAGTQGEMRKGLAGR